VLPQFSGLENKPENSIIRFEVFMAVTMKNAISWAVLHMAFVRNVSEERIASIIKVTRIGAVGTALAVTSN
jgi:hypothetical protein